MFQLKNRTKVRVVRALDLYGFQRCWRMKHPDQSKKARKALSQLFDTCTKQTGLNRMKHLPRIQTTGGKYNTPPRGIIIQIYSNQATSSAYVSAENQPIYTD